MCYRTAILMMRYRTGDVNPPPDIFFGAGGQAETGAASRMHGPRVAAHAT